MLDAGKIVIDEGCFKAAKGRRAELIFNNPFPTIYWSKINKKEKYHDDS